MRSLPLQNSQTRSSPATCQPKHSLTLASKWLPIPTMVRTQQVLEAAEPQEFSLPLSCVFRHCSSAEEQQFILYQRCSSGSRLAQGTEASLGQAYTSTKTATDALMVLDVRTSPASPAHVRLQTRALPQTTVLRVPIMRRCPDNHAGQVNISDSIVFFSQASDKPG